MPDPKRPIRRAATGTMLGGVCAGLAEWLGWDASVVRVAYVLATFFTGIAPGVLAYLALWILVPRAEALTAPQRAAESGPTGAA